MTKVSKNKPILSVITVDYNAGEYFNKLIASIANSSLTDYIEVIVTDNLSQDGSYENVINQKYSHPKINFKFLQNGANYGFSKGNNQGVNISDPKSKYVLFINPDTTVNKDTLQGMINYFEKNTKVDAATCDVILAVTGKTQLDSHRDFPTPLNTFLHFTGISSRPYFMQHLDYSVLQPINCCVGAFFMMKRTVGQKVGWWNEKYFMYGEDLDFCYKIKKLGYQLYFVPDYKITHYQGISSGIKKTISSASRETKVRSAIATTSAMRTFYQENLIQGYPLILHPLIYLGINLLQLYRVFKAKYL